MSNLTVPKCMLWSPSRDEMEDEPSLVALKHANLYETVKTSQETSEQELHQNRLKYLRKQLDYLKETAWKFEPIEKYIGQSFRQTGH